MKLLEKLKFGVKKKKARFIMSFIGTLFFRIGGIASMGISQCGVYITSYFHYNGVNINMQYSNLIMPILVLSNSLFAPLAGLLEKKLGLYVSLIISSLLLELDIILFINQTNILFSFILIIFIGFSQGIGASIPVKNIFYYYPKKAGLLRSLIVSSYLLIGTGISIIGEKAFNPDKYTLSKGEQFYPFEISKNYITFYKYILITNPICLSLALLFIKKYDPSLEENILQEEQVNELNNKNKKIKKDGNYSKNIKTAIMNKRLFRIIGITTLTPFVSSFSRNTFRVYGALASVSGAVMQYNQLFTGFSNVFVGPIWGYVNDKYKYDIIIKILSISFILQSLVFSIFIKSNTIYIINIIFGSIISNGFTSCSSLHILRVYGINYNLEIEGSIGIFSGIFNILNALLSFIISKYFHTGEELQYAYRFIYIACIFISGFGLILTLQEKENKFIYPFPEKDEDYSNMINSNNNDKDKNEIITSESKEIELKPSSSEITED